MASGSDFTDLRVYQAAESLSQIVWDVVLKWDGFAKATVGEQLVRSIDSVGANIAEAHGRFHFGDRLRFLYYARGSLYECRHWLRQAFRRRLLSGEDVKTIQQALDALPVSLNNYINSIRSQQSESSLREQNEAYDTDFNLSIS